MRDFLEPRGGPLGLLSRFEVACLVAGVTSLASTWPLAAIPTMSEVAAGAGVGLLAAGIGSFVRGLQWRRLLSRHAIDPNATVYYERGEYARIVERVVDAHEVDLAGISLLYALEYIKDHLGEYVQHARHTRILLPATRAICDGRDIAQGTEPGGLWNGVMDAHRLLSRIRSQHPSSFSVQYFTVQPYFAMTRVDGRVWVSPYVTMSGRSSPVISVEKERSPELYRTFTTHFQTLWLRSLPAPQP